MATEVKCRSGNVYELKLGPALMARMKAGAQKIIPGSLQTKMAKATNDNMSEEEIRNIMSDVMSPEEADHIGEQSVMAEVTNLRMTLKSLNGETIEDINVLLEEEMSAEDFEELIAVIDEHQVRFNKGREEEGESSLSSVGTGKKVSLAESPTS